MLLKRLALKDFRNFSSGRIEFDTRANLLLGDNAQGKTSLLEAVYYMAITRPVRGASPKDLIRHETDGFRLKGLFDAGGQSFEIEASFDGSEKRFSIDGVRKEGIADLIGQVPVVLFGMIS